MSNQIRFSFLPLVSSDFSFTIYRRAADGVKLDNEYKYSLPFTSGQTDIRDDYFISFVKGEGNIQYQCHSRDNNALTQKWLIYQLENKSSAVLSPGTFFVGRRFVPRISYIIKRTEYGCQVIDIEPYFLRKTQEFGFTIDFRFDAKDKYQNKLAVDKLSLSLSPDGQKNKNKYADKLRLVSGFISSTLGILFPIDGIDISHQLKSMPFSILKEKEYVFGDGNVDNNQFSGLTKYKPLMQPSQSMLVGDFYGFFVAHYVYYMVVRSRRCLSVRLPEHSAVNRRVVGSNPTGGARKAARFKKMCRFAFSVYTNHAVQGALPGRGQICIKSSP